MATKLETNAQYGKMAVVIPIGDNCGHHCGTILSGGIGTITEHCLCGECHNGVVECDIRSAYPNENMR